jgi:hypothetical protein
MFRIDISNTMANNAVRATVRYTVEEDACLGKKYDSWTEEKTLELIGGCVLGRTEVLCNVFGQKVTTMVVEGIDDLSLPLITEVSERNSVFGVNSVTVVRIKSSIEAAMDQARPVRSSRPMPGRTISNISISIKRAERPRW